MKVSCELCGKNEGDEKYSKTYLICKSCYNSGHICPTCKTNFVRRKIFCSKGCFSKNTRTRKRCSEVLAQTNRKYASERMRTNNPVHKKGVLEKIARTKKKNGTFNVAPKKRGGNGTFTKQQLRLNSKLCWTMELPIKTAPDNIPVGKKREFSAKLSMPTTYKVDIGNPITKIAIEIDGESHKGKRKCLDLKKEKYLKSLGWTVLRFTNKEVMTNFSTVLFRILKRNRIILRSMI